MYYIMVTERLKNKPYKKIVQVIEYNPLPEEDVKELIYKKMEDFIGLEHKDVSLEDTSTFCYAKCETIV